MRSNKKTLIVFCALAALIGAACYGLLSWRGAFRSPEAALSAFATSEGLAEEQLMDPLILAGPDVIPKVIQYVQEPNAARRRYAITYLGNSQADSAIPVLLGLLEDESEAEAIRGDALSAIAMIDFHRGKTLAVKYASQDDYLGKISRLIVSEDPRLLAKRTYLDALLSVRD